MKILFFMLFFNCFVVHAAPPPVLYRAVMEAPDVVKQMKGFLPKGADGSRPNQPPVDISLYNHVTGSASGLARYDSGYVATTESFTTAHYWVNNNLNGRGYIYYIQPTGNMIDVNGSLGQFSPHPGEMEYAALGTIPWRQIIGWQQVDFGTLRDFEHNPDYRRNLYHHTHVAGAVPELAGFPPDHQAWTLEPWRDFANCGPSSLLRQNICRPKESAEIFGTRHFFKENGKLLFISLIPSL